MSLIVQKYGGTSVGSPERIKAVAARIARARAAGNDLVVVVSAMGHTTDQLIELARQIHPEPPRRELDMLLTAGERISMSLLAMALRLEGLEAISFTGSQSGIITDSCHGGARILEVRGDRIREELGRGRVVIVAGFQGVSREREITTLGRGGSDATAVAIAGALRAERCEIYTDVVGVMTADPRLVPGARLIPHLDYDTALTLTTLGAGVLMPRAAALARKLGVLVQVRSAWEEHAGTTIDGEEMLNDGAVAAVTSTGGVVLEEVSTGAIARSPEAVAVGADSGIEPPSPGSWVLGRAVLTDSRELLARFATGAVGAERASRPAGELISIVCSGRVPAGASGQFAEVIATLGTIASPLLAGPRSLSAYVPAGAAAGGCPELHRRLVQLP